MRDTLARYCHGVDRGDREMIMSAYHRDGHDDHGGYKGDPAGFADYIIKKFDDAPEIGQHHITNVLIELDGDRAKVLSYFLALNPG
ncbi:nuclear transport factor 2 family protein, partial [Klebsiella pneumoniae]